MRLDREPQSWPKAPPEVPAGDKLLRPFLAALVVALGGVLVAAGLFPLVGGAGAAVKRFDERFIGASQGDLTIPAFPQRSTIYAADGSELAVVADYNRRYVPLKDVNDVTRQAVLAIEDDKFYKHGPIDLTAIIRAAVANLQAGKVVQGGSTITQQLVKNTETGNDQTFERKFKEAQEAIRLEQTYSKDEILEMYLNEVYFGHGAYGIASAAEYYFAKEPEDLSLQQAAVLAGLIAAPSQWDPIDHHSAALARRNQVIDRMLSLGWITQEQHDKAVGSKIKLSDKERNVNKFGPQPYFVSYIEDQILHAPKGSPLQKVLGKTAAERRHALFQGGLKIYTTLKPQFQQWAQEAVNSHLPRQGPRPPDDPEAAVVTVVPQTGAIQAMYGGKDFSKSKFNLATQSSRTAGSSFKAFTLAAAFEQGIPVGKVYDATQPIHIPSDKCPDPDGEWSPGNAEPAEGGLMNMSTATALSVNVYFAQLIADVGPENVADVAKRMGVWGDVPPVCAITLGAVGVSPLAMTSGYSTLANEGVHCQPFAITRITNAGGKRLFKATPNCDQAITPQVAAQVTSLLKLVVSQGTGTAANIGRPQAGKTGTGQEYQDAWFMGYIPQLTTGVWVGYSADEIPMRGLRVLGGGNAFGGTIAAPIWHDYMIKAVQGLPVEDFPAPPPPKSGRVPNVVGLMKDEAEKVLSDANFTAITREVDSNEPAGTVVAQNPGAGATVPLGSAVTISVSNGHAPKPPPPKMVKVPDVVGMAEADARAALTAAGFKVAVQYQQSGHAKDGLVLSQNPNGGTKAEEGSTVVIVVGKHEEPSPGPSPEPTPTP